MTKTSKRLATRGVMTALVLAHLWPNLQHGAAHNALEVPPPPGWTWFVYIVILLLPIVAVVFLWTRFLVPALGVLAAAFSSATVFGVYHHFVKVSIDNVFHLPDGPIEVHEAFSSSATAIAGVEFLTTVLATFLFGYWTALRRNES